MSSRTVNVLIIADACQDTVYEAVAELYRWSTPSLSFYFECLYIDEKPFVAADHTISPGAFKIGITTWRGLIRSQLQHHVNYVMCTSSKDETESQARIIFSVISKQIEQNKTQWDMAHISTPEFCDFIANFNESYESTTLNQPTFSQTHTLMADDLLPDMSGLSIQPVQRIVPIHIFNRWLDYDAVTLIQAIYRLATPELNFVISHQVTPDSFLVHLSRNNAALHGPSSLASHYVVPTHFHPLHTARDIVDAIKAKLAHEEERLRSLSD